MTMSSDQYETGNSSVKISDGAKGSTVEVKVYAKPMAGDKRSAKIIDELDKFITLGSDRAHFMVDDADHLSAYIRHLESQIPDLDAAQKQANALHLKTAATVERNGGIIVYDPEQRLLAAWNDMEEHDAEAGA